MTPHWCPVCCTNHVAGGRCPGELLATGDERPGWRVNVETATGIDAVGVLVAPSYDLWRARILTYPNILWSVPGGTGTLKFVGRTPEEAERKAVRFLREHCHERGMPLRDAIAEVTSSGARPAEVAPPPVEAVTPPPPTDEKPAERVIRFLPVRFGVVRPIERAGTGNLSETGLFIITEAPVPAGRDVDVLLTLEGQKVPMSGAVRWMRNGHHVGRAPGMGVQLRRPPETYVDFVRSLT